MGRRFAGIGGKRRNIRDGSASASVYAQTSAVFGSALRFSVDSSAGYTFGAADRVQTWTDQKQGIVLAAAGSSNRPAFVSSAAAFGGRPVIRGVKASSYGLFNASVSGVAAATEMIYVAIVGQSTAAPAGFNELGIHAADSANNTKLHLDQGGPQQARINATGGTSTYAFNVGQSAAHLFEWWLASDGAHFWLDGAEVSTSAGATGGLQTTLAKLGIFASAVNGTSNPGDWDIAQHVIGVGTTAAQRLAYRSVVESTYGIDTSP